MRLTFPYFNDSDIGYLDTDFLVEGEDISFVRDEENESDEENENKQIQSISERK